MAVLEIQANGDTRVTEEAITRARHSLSDPNMRVSSLPHPSQLVLKGSMWGHCGVWVRPGGAAVHAAEGDASPAAQRPTCEEGLSSWCVLSFRPEGFKGPSKEGETRQILPL